MCAFFDDKDAKILDERLRFFNKQAGFRVGDYVEFADGVVRRISHIWHNSVQTSDGGSFYLGDGFCSFSGALYPGVNPETLTLTDKERAGQVWFFHHDYMVAHNGVYVDIPFRVYACSEPSNK